jgi:hypothetical protein
MSGFETMDTEEPTESQLLADFQIHDAAKPMETDESPNSVSNLVFARYTFNDNIYHHFVNAFLGTGFKSVVNDIAKTIHVRPEEMMTQVHEKGMVARFITFYIFRNEKGKIEVSLYLNPTPIGIPTMNHIFSTNRDGSIRLPEICKDVLKHILREIKMFDIHLPVIVSADIYLNRKTPIESQKIAFHVDSTNAVLTNLVSLVYLFQQPHTYTFGPEIISAGYTNEPLDILRFLVGYGTTVVFNNHILYHSSPTIHLSEGQHDDLVLHLSETDRRRLPRVSVPNTRFEQRTQTHRGIPEEIRQNVAHHYNDPRNFIRFWYFTPKQQYTVQPVDTRLIYEFDNFDEIESFIGKNNIRNAIPQRDIELSELNTVLRDINNVYGVGRRRIKHRPRKTIRRKKRLQKSRRKRA